MTVSAAILPFEMNDETLRRRIAAIAADSSRVIVTEHAKKRMRERRVLLTQVLAVLLRGRVVEHAHLDVHGCWKCTLQLSISGDRLRVAAAITEDIDGGAVVVITVMH